MQRGRLAGGVAILCKLRLVRVLRGQLSCLDVDHSVLSEDRPLVAEQNPTISVLSAFSASNNQADSQIANRRDGSSIFVSQSLIKVGDNFSITCPFYFGAFFVVLSGYLCRIITIIMGDRYATDRPLSNS